EKQGGGFAEETALVRKALPMVVGALLLGLLLFAAHRRNVEDVRQRPSMVLCSGRVRAPGVLERSEGRQAMDVTIRVDEPGRYTYYCATVCATNRLHPRMTGTLVVE